MLSAACPACGAPVLFRGATSIVAVCPHCRSTLVRSGTRVEDVGRASTVLEDHSPLQLHAAGAWRGAAFTVVGRIQLRHDRGVWSEWHLAFANGRSGWLADDMGELVLEFLQPPAPLPELAQLVPGRRVTLAGADFEVVERSRSTVAAVEGELPLRVLPGAVVETIDLRDPEGRFATLDFGDGTDPSRPVVITTGHAVTLAELGMTGLRAVADLAAAPAVAGAARAFDCPSCGAPLAARLATTEALACPGCGAVIDLTDERHRIVSRSAQVLAQLAPVVPLGAQGELQGTRFEVVGLMRRSMQDEGRRYAWDEYLLHHPTEGYRFLVHEDGHFGLARLTRNLPRVRPPAHVSDLSSAEYLGRRFRHYAGYVARVEAVAGEFFWKVQVGDEVQVEDYVDPPLLLSCERVVRETTWSLEEYLAPAAVWAAFRLPGAPPAPRGVAAHQPAPLQGRVGTLLRMAGAFALLAVAVHLGAWAWSDGRVLVRQTVESPARGAAARFRSEGFAIDGRGPQTIEVRTRFAMLNTWVGVDFDLVELDSGTRYAFAQDLAYYSDGPGDDEPEGSPADRLRVERILPGRYLLEVETSGDPDRAAGIGGTVELRRAGPDASNLAFALVALVAWPAVALLRRASFEQRRWADSDHAPDDDD